jgi:2-hydroxychromene-2-carboxylate isomerase
VRVALSHALYRAYFVDNRDIADRAVLAEVARGLPVEVRRIDEPGVHDALRAATDRALADGVFGVPAFVVTQAGTRHLFFGQDRMHLVERALGGWAVPA